MFIMGLIPYEVFGGIIAFELDLEVSGLIPYEVLGVIIAFELDLEVFGVIIAFELVLL